MDRTAVLYDADCNICKTIAEAVLTWDRRARLRPVAIQSDEGQRLLKSIPRAKRLESFHLVHPDGTVTSGGAALAKLFDALPGGWGLARMLGLSPRTTNAGYEWVARNRIRLSRFIPGRVKSLANRRLTERS